MILPLRKPDLWFASPASKVKVLGVPVVLVGGVVTIGLLVFNLYEWLSNDAYVVNKHGSLLLHGRHVRAGHRHLRGRAHHPRTARASTSA